MAKMEKILWNLHVHIGITLSMQHIANVKKFYFFLITEWIFKMEFVHYDRGLAQTIGLLRDHWTLESHRTLESYISSLVMLTKTLCTSLMQRNTMGAFHLRRLADNVAVKLGSAYLRYENRQPV